MLNSPFPKDSAISQLLRSYVPEENIFRQGRPGENMFILVEGYARIVYEGDDTKHLVGIVGPGEVFGEKAIFQKEKKNPTRTFSAYAATHVTLLEVTPKTLNLVLTTWPDFYTRVINLVENRLDKANELIGILQNPNVVDRVCLYIQYFQKHLCAKLPKGSYATVSLEEIMVAANVEREITEDIVQDLVNRKVLSEVADGYVLINETALLQSIPSLRQSLAA